MNKLVLNMALIFLCGCTLIPSYHRPPSPVSDQWPENSPSKNKVAVADIGWREFFADARLQKLIEIALLNNRDLRIAALNTEQLRAQYRLFDRAFLPEFSADANSLHERSAGTTGKHPLTHKYSALVNTAYEIDLFGHIRSLKTQALEQYWATSEAQRSAQLVLISEIAIQYINAQALAEELELSKETLKSVQSYYQLVKSSYELGKASALDLHSTEAQVQTAMTDIASYERQYEQAQDALEFLIGQKLPADLPPAQSLTTEKLLTDLSPGVPSDLLVRRPDILEAEHQLKIANANIGVVRSQFFPKITLTAAEGVSSVQLSKLFIPGSNVWSLAPEINLPLFNRANNRANLDAAYIGKSIEIARYEKAIQNAFREVSDILIARRTLNEQIQAQKALVHAQEQRYQLAGERYKSGVDNYLNVLTAQQDLYVAQQSLIQAEFLRLSNLISFYKALGGGWQEHTLQY